MDLTFLLIFVNFSLIFPITTHIPVIRNKG